MPGDFVGFIETVPEAACSVCVLGAQNGCQWLSLLSRAQMSAPVFSEVLFNKCLIIHRGIHMISAVRTFSKKLLLDRVLIRGDESSTL